MSIVVMVLGITIKTPSMEMLDKHKARKRGEFPPLFFLISSSSSDSDPLFCPKKVARRARAMPHRPCPRTR